MNRLAVVRLIAVLAGAAALFTLQHRLGVAFYFAFPVAIVVYLAVKVAIGLLWGSKDKAT